KITLYSFSNNLFSLVKNLPSNKLLPIVILRMVLDSVAAMKFLFSMQKTHFSAVLKAHLYFYKLLPLLLKKRKNLQKRVGYYTKISVVCARFLKGKKIFSEVKV